MNKSTSFLLKPTQIIHHNPFTKGKYLFSNKNSNNTQGKTLKQIMFNHIQFNDSFQQKQCHIINRSLSSLNLFSKELSKTTIEYKSNVSTSIISDSLPKSLVYRKNNSKVIDKDKSITRPQSSTRPLLKNNLSSPSLSKGSLNTPKVNRCTSITKDIQDIYNKGIKNQIQFFNKKYNTDKAKVFPILTQKKKIPNILPNEHDDGFLKTPNEIQLQAFVKIERIQRKNINRHLNAANKNITIDYSKEFNLVPAENFSPSYQRICNLVNMSQKQSSDVDIKNIDTPFINNFNIILPTDKDTKRIRRKSITIEKRYLFAKIRIVMIKAAIHLKQWGISLEKFYKKKYEIVPPYEGHNLRMAIGAIKDNDNNSVKERLMFNRYLLIDSDIFGQTVLHWLCKRNMYQLITQALKKNADIGAVDKIGRTPLHLASEMNHFESVVVLLFGMADPYAKNSLDLRPFDHAKISSIQHILRRAEEIHLQFKHLTPKNFRREIRRNLKFIMTIELNLLFENYEPYLLLD